MRPRRKQQSKKEEKIMASTANNDDNELIEADVHINPTQSDPDADWDVDW